MLKVMRVSLASTNTMITIIHTRVTNSAIT
jgi:hypothetical protein